jgi:hypothetical protein
VTDTNIDFGAKTRAALEQLILAHGLRRLLDSINVICSAALIGSRHRIWANTPPDVHGGGYAQPVLEIAGFAEAEHDTIKWPNRRC